MQIFNQNKFIDLLKQHSKMVNESDMGWEDIGNRPGRMIELIKKFNHHDEFYTLYSIRENKVLWHWGFKTYMGYPMNSAQEMTIDFYIGLIHPFVRQWMNAFLAGTQKVIMENCLSRMDFLESRYCVNLPMKKANGTYMLIKQFTMPFTFDKNGILETYLNCHVVVDKYKGEPLKPRFFHGAKRNTGDEMLLKQEAAHFLKIPKENLLTPQLLETINIFKQATQIRKGILSKATAQSIIKKNNNEYLKKDAINKNRQRIKAKLLPLLELPNYNTKDKDELELLKWIPDFEDTYTLIDFMLESGIVDVLEYYKKQKLYLKEDA